MTDTTVRTDGNALRLPGGVAVRFIRTLRLPESGSHALPPGLGEFPIRRVADYGRGPGHRREVWGGVQLQSFPLTDRELARWREEQRRRAERARPAVPFDAGHDGPVPMSAPPAPGAAPAYGEAPGAAPRAAAAMGPWGTLRTRPSRTATGSPPTRRARLHAAGDRRQGVCGDEDE